MYIHKPWKTFFAPTIIKYEKPTVNDYQYDVPTVWLDKTSDICYMLVDNTMGAAEWVSRENSNSGDSVWVLYGQNACYLAGNVGIATPEPNQTLTIAGTIGGGEHGTEFTVAMSGNVVCGSVNNQIISNVASFTGTVNADGGFKVGGSAVSGNVLKADGSSFKSSALTKSDVGLANVDNTSDVNKPISSATTSALAAKADLVDGKVPSTQLPTTVFLELGNSSTNAYYGDKGKIAYDHSLLVTGNPHEVTKSDVGLANVDNTSDTAKPISSAVSLALTTKADLVTGKVPYEQLPPMSYQVVNYSTGANFPIPGNAQTYYVALDTMYVYLWGGDGVGYVMITGSLAIADNSVTMAKIQDIDTNTVIGRVASGAGDPKALSASELRTILGSVGIAGDSLWDAAGDLVVGSGADTAVKLAKGSSGQVLTAGATTLSWQTPATGGGTITAVTGASPIISSGGTTPEISLPAATASAPGHATAAQITKLDGIEASANNYIHPTTQGNLHVPTTAGATTGQALLVGTPGSAAAWGTISTSGAVTVADTSSIDLTLAGSQISGVVLPAGVNHDSLSNYSANKHVDHSTVSVIAGTGMSGGGTLTESRTLNCTVVGYSATTARSDLLSSVSPIVNDTTKAPNCTTVVTALALKANLASPVFTGTISCDILTASGTITGAKIKTPYLNTSYIPYYDSTNGLTNSVIQTVSSLIGIGISPTKSLLHIAGATAANAQIKLESSTIEPTSPDIGSLWFYTDGGGVPYLKFKKTSASTVDLLSMVGATQWITNASNIYFGTVTVGKVGIGTSAPGAQLHVYGTDAAGLESGRFENTSTTGYCEFRVKSGTNDLYFGACSPGYVGTGFEAGSWIWNTGAGKLSLGTNNTERMTIAGNGVISEVIPDGKYRWFSKTQSTSIANSTSVYTVAENQYPFIAGVCVAINHTTIKIPGAPATSDISWYPSYMSKVTIPSGAGCDQFGGCTTYIGDGPMGGNSNIGLIHKVACAGQSGDLAAVWHMVEISGQTVSERAETAAISYYHHINTVGKAYSSVLEGQQIFDNMAYGNGLLTLGSRGGFGWHHVVNVHSNCAAYMPQYAFINVTTSGAAAYNSWSGAQVLAMSGKWNTLLACSGLFGALTVNVCGLDLYTNITYGSYVPAIKISSNTFIDMYGADTGKCKIAANSTGGLYAYTRKSDGTSVIAFDFNDGSTTYLRIGNVLYWLTVSGTSIVATAT